MTLPPKASRASGGDKQKFRAEAGRRPEDCGKGNRKRESGSDLVFQDGAEQKAVDQFGELLSVAVIGFGELDDRAMEQSVCHSAPQIRW
ncbi:hypothetical protein [Kribbella karoonensis]|uniref:Uncharacterized protein n=1 Tax=Kribbella karoonensis TaxID=324851 RepID=A0ABN2D379_9ACTN